MLLGKWMQTTGDIYANFQGCAFDCLAGTYGDSPSLTAPDQCTACPAGTSSAAGSSSMDSCVCPIGMFDSSKGDEEPACILCMDNNAVDCTTPGVKLASLRIKPNRWRRSADSTAIERCYTEGVCVGANASQARTNATSSDAIEGTSTQRQGPRLEPLLQWLVVSCHVLLILYVQPRCS